MKGIIIYCHGLGSNKKWATRFYNRLLENKLGIYAFDFPGHGEDGTEFSQFTLNSCISYLNDVISYVDNKYNVPIYLFGCSFGGFVILNRLIVKRDDIKSTILMCPAINFCEIMERKSGISNDYFNTNEYMPLYNNIKIYEQAYIEFKNGNLQLKNFKFNNISIIHGTLDKTVDYENIKKVCDQSVLKYLSKKTKIDYQIRNQSEFNLQPEIYKAVSSVIKNKNKIQGMLDPKNEHLKIRIACPKCGLVDKEGLTTKIMKKEILAKCPSHGQYKAIYKSESSKLEYNTPLRNLIRGMVYGMINSSSSYDYEIIRITGGDYSGFYQEELLYKCASLCKYDVSKLPIILYCPQILDWSGAKLSKSIYVQDGAYNDLPKYMLNYKELHSIFKNKGLDILQEETDNWLAEPYKLFRNYSVYYFIQKFEKEIEKDDRFKKSSERNN